MLSLILIAGFSSALATTAATATTVIPRPSTQLSAAAEAERIGEDIYDFDQAAWGATDALVAAIADPAGAGVHGWIVEREPGGTVATFYGLDSGRPYKLFVAHMRGQKPVSQHVVAATEDRGVTPVEARMIAAREAALAPDTLRKIDFRPCGKGAVNAVVLPPASAGAPVAVYLLTPQATLDRFPFGGHYRVDVAADGSIVRSRGFANSCIALDRKAVPQHREATLFMLTNMLDRQPTEIHAWISRASHIPLLVLTVPGGDAWTVAEGRIHYQYTLPGTPAARQ